MVEVSKCDHECYCASCGESASYILAINDKRIIQPGREALCKKCMELLKNAIDKIVKE
jgi:hypothetical protein